MPRPIWSGAISFGLINIPVQLMPAERRNELHLRMLDRRDNARIRYERLNADTGKEVPWKEIVKAYEYEKGNYVVLDDEDLREASPEGKDSVDIEAFVDADAIGPQYFERPYYLVPARKAEKGYVLLRDTLRAQKRAGLARVVIRTREYLCLVVPQDQALLLLLMRYPEELIDADTYAFPDAGAKGFRISAREREMAEQLVQSMAADWKPAGYRNEFHERLHRVIQQRIERKGTVHPPERAGEAATGDATNVVDFMALLKKSLADKKRTPAATRPAVRARRAAPRVRHHRRRRA